MPYIAWASAWASSDDVYSVEPPVSIFVEATKCGKMSVDIDARRTFSDAQNYYCCRRALDLETNELEAIARHFVDTSIDRYGRFEMTCCWHGGSYTIDARNAEMVGYPVVKNWLMTFIVNSKMRRY